METEAIRKESPHLPVLLDEVLESFGKVREVGVFVDCTLGYAGHSEAVLEAHPDLTLIGIDRDPEALNFSAKRLEAFTSRIELLHGSFSELLPEILLSRNVTALLADFGVSSLQLDRKERGFSFESETLDMRMDPDQKLNAYEVVNRYGAENLERIFRDYGEIRPARKLAQTIVKRREERPIESGKELALLAEKILPSKGRTHPATQLFQAIRIEVNDELGEIRRLLDALEAHPPSGAVVSLITFHSLEDRLVKQRFREWSRECICPSRAPRCSCGGDHALGEALHRKPIVAGEKEQADNPRSRSAKLRSFRFKKNTNPGRR